MTGKAVNVAHHSRGPMDAVEEVAEEFLRPPTDLVDGSSVVQDLFGGVAVTDPPEFGSPKELSVLADAPAPAAGFANKGVVVAFSLGTGAGSKTDWSQTSALHGKVKGADAIGAQKGQGNLGCFGVVWLHEDPPHASCSPVCF